MKAWFLVIGLGLAASSCARPDELQPFRCSTACLVPTIVKDDPSKHFPPGTVYSYNQHRLGVGKADAEAELLRELYAASGAPDMSCCALCEAGWP